MNRGIGRWIQIGLFAAMPLGTAFAQGDNPAMGSDVPSVPAPSDSVNDSTRAQKKANDTTDHVPTEMPDNQITPAPSDTNKLDTQGDINKLDDTNKLNDTDKLDTKGDINKLDDSTKLDDSASKLNKIDDSTKLNDSTTLDDSTKLNDTNKLDDSIKSDDSTKLDENKDTSKLNDDKSIGTEERSTTETTTHKKVTKHKKSPDTNK